MKIALSVSRGRIAPVLDVSRRFLIIEDRQVTEITLEEDVDLKSAELAEIGVTALVCGAVSRYAETIFISKGIKLIPFVCGDIDSVIDAIRAEKIEEESFLMPGCCGRRNGMGRHLMGRQGLRQGNRNGSGPGRGMGRGGRFNR